jgi:hypothetical protein
MDNGLAALKASGAVRQARACKHPESNAPESNKFDRAAYQRDYMRKRRAQATP